MASLNPLKNRFLLGASLSMLLSLPGCAGRSVLPDSVDTADALGAEACAVEEVRKIAHQAKLFRLAETERAESLSGEIARLKADLATAESALVEAESGLAASHSRANAISTLAVTRIQVERAASSAPWRADEIAAARNKLEEAERQVAEGHFGAALFFVYRARRVAESIQLEAEEVMQSSTARLIQSPRVNLRAGPSTNDRILSVLEEGTPVIPQTTRGEWLLVQVAGGPAGWIYRRLLGDHAGEFDSLPAAPRP